MISENYGSETYYYTITVVWNIIHTFVTRALKCQKVLLIKRFILYENQASTA
jgi:hypothetical protein